MQYIKKLKPLCCFLIVSVLLQGCQSPLVAYRYPRGQANSVWSTDDGAVAFSVGAEESDPVYGMIKTDDGSVEIETSMGPFTTFVYFYYKEDRINSHNDYEAKAFAEGHGKIISRKEYHVEITYAEAYFEVGQILTFYRQNAD